MDGRIHCLHATLEQRVNKVNYLSFLPMNHVVEGILAMYSLDYAPAKLNLYYLTDFNELSQALTMVKPPYSSLYLFWIL